MRIFVLSLLTLSTVAHAEDFTPPAAETVTNYSATALPCKLQDNPMTGRNQVICQDNLLEKKSMRELAIMRNTIFARYGWSGYRKEWLRSYFGAQPWFKPNPKFTYKLLNDIDRKNAHFIGAHEQSLTDGDLKRRKNDVLARYGKVWDDVPEWDVKGKKVKACKKPKNADEGQEESLDTTAWACVYGKQPWYKPNPNFKESMISAEDRIELGIIDRMLGNFAIDSERRDKVADTSSLFKVDELRQLSLRDLRILRNTIYARHGRKFKSKILQDHFNGLEWYKIDPAYNDKVLTKTDERNIAMIRTVENEFGGAITDEETLTEPAIDGA